jgi:iron complex transport system substrate-binding protein
MGRFTVLAAALGAGPHPGSAELVLAEEELRAAVAGGGAPRAVALSPAGPEQVHLARPATWPELRRLAELGLPMPDPGPGPGVNWLTVDWEQAAEAAAGARLVLADCRANAVPVAELAEVPAWGRLTRAARVLPWNPELPPAPGAVAAFLRSVTAALRTA